mmetsp:Transcript_60868/g.170616  ORF Transcript_60868/g.170616 Transcript_60868/m.170616 type:complete len:153 (-) Transcript_60868:128-586(-)
MAVASAAWADAASDFNGVERAGAGTEKVAGNMSGNRIQWPEQFSEISSSSSGSSHSSSLASLGLGSLPPPSAQGVFSNAGMRGPSRGNQWNLQDRWPEKPDGTAQATAAARVARLNATDTAQQDASSTPAASQSAAEDQDAAAKAKKTIISL